MKRLRLLIARWALKPQDITNEDILQVVGIDIAQVLDKSLAVCKNAGVEAAEKVAKDQLDKSLQSQVTEIAKNVAAKDLGELSPVVLAAIVSQSKTLREDQKTALLGILATDSRPHYLQ